MPMRPPPQQLPRSQQQAPRHGGGGGGGLEQSKSEPRLDGGGASWSPQDAPLVVLVHGYRRA